MTADTPTTLPIVSLDDPDLTRAVARALHALRCHDCHYREGFTLSDHTEAEAALAAVRAHLEEVGR